jgi:hypothetical protein
MYGCVLQEKTRASVEFVLDRSGEGWLGLVKAANVDQVQSQSASGHGTTACLT